MSHQPEGTRHGGFYGGTAKTDLLGLTSLSNDEIIVQDDVAYISSPGYNAYYECPTEPETENAEPFVEVMCSALN